MVLGVVMISLVAPRFVFVVTCQFDDDVEGTGMGQGEGKKDVTDQIEDEEQLLGLKGEEPDKDEAEQAKELGEVRSIGRCIFLFLIWPTYQEEGVSKIASRHPPPPFPPLSLYCCRGDHDTCNLMLQLAVTKPPWAAPHLALVNLTRI